MSTTMKIVWLFTLVFFVGGCSTYKVVAPRQEIGEPGAVDGTDFEIKKGDEVRMTLRNGDTVSGKVLATISNNVILDSKNYHEFSTETDKDVGDVQIPFEDIQSIEKRGFSVGNTVALVVGIAAPLVLIGVTSDGWDMGGAGGGDLGSIGPYNKGW